MPAAENKGDHEEADEDERDVRSPIGRARAPQAAAVAGPFLALGMQRSAHDAACWFLPATSRSLVCTMAPCGVLLLVEWARADHLKQDTGGQDWEPGDQETWMH